MVKLTKTIPAIFLYCIALNMTVINNTQATEQKTLATCPNTPNCVSSLSYKKAQYVRPFRLNQEHQQAWKQITKLILNIERTKLVAKNEHWQHFEFTSRIFKFTDDMELLFDPDKNIIHIRSASRIGYSDLGANRKRVEKVHSILQQAGIVK